MSNSDRIIDLTQGTVPQALEEQYLVHRNQLNQISEQIKKSVNSKKDNKYDKDNIDLYRFVSKNRKDNVFFIQGQRGSGKTTFMMSLVKKLISDRGKKSPELRLLTWIDPTMVETGENIFYSLVQYLKETIDEVTSRNWDRQDTEYEEWRKTFKRLAKGLSLLDQNDKPFSSYDAILNMEENLSRAKGGSELEIDFDRLLEKSVNILKIDAFVVAFDDVDMSFDKGFEVLELIRRYLRNDKLLVLVSGDLDLYEYMVSKQYQTQFDSKRFPVVSIQSENAPHINTEIDELTRQFLLKVFPTQNRLRLSPLLELIDGNEGENIKVKVSDEKYISLEQAITYIVKKSWNYQEDTDINKCKILLLSRSLRDIIQILLSNLHTLQYKTENKKQDETENNKTLGNYFLHFFEDSLRKAGINPDFMTNTSWNHPLLLKEVFNFMVNSKVDFKSTLLLVPTGDLSDEINNLAILSLSSLVSEACSGTPEIALRYLLFCPSSAYITLLPSQDRNKLIDYINRLGQVDLYRWSQGISSILIEQGSNSIATGVVKIKEESKTQYNLNDLIQLYSHKLLEKENEKTYYLSVFGIIGIIERFLSISIVESDTGGKDNLKTNIQKCWKEILETKRYVLPKFNVSSQNILPEIDYNYQEINLLSANENMTELIKTWLENVAQFRKDLAPSSSLLGKVWLRLFDELRQAENESNIITISDWLKKNTKALINAWLKEEKEEIDAQSDNDNLESEKSTINDNLDLERFIVDLQNESNKAILKKNYPFTYIIFTCPFIYLWLLDETEKTEFIYLCILEQTKKTKTIKNLFALDNIIQDKVTIYEQVNNSFTIESNNNTEVANNT